MKLNARSASQEGLVLGQCRERHKDADFAWKPRRPKPTSIQCLVCGHGVVRTNPTREREFRLLTDEEYRRSASGAVPVLGEQALLELYLEWHEDDFWPSMLTPDRIALTGAEARKRGLRLGHCWGDHFVCFDGNWQGVLW